ncbi:MAG: T6SS effector amidase Tae4 family protein [Chitinophagaceae bacterium]
MEEDQLVANEQEVGLSDNDPNLIWWDENTSDPNTTYFQQNKPSYQNMYANYPKSGYDDMSAKDVCTMIGGEMLVEYNAGRLKNACALRVSRALNYSGIIIPNIQGQTGQGGDGKNYFYKAEMLYNWLVHTFGPADIHKTATDGAPNGTKFRNQLSGIQNKGIYIMKPKSQLAFGASGHATLWGGLDCIGGHNFFAAANDIYIWKLN